MKYLNILSPRPWELSSDGTWAHGGTTDNEVSQYPVTYPEMQQTADADVAKYMRDQRQALAAAALVQVLMLKIE
jgi:hypothetical protein